MVILYQCAFQAIHKHPAFRPSLMLTLNSNNHLPTRKRSLIFQHKLNALAGVQLDVPENLSPLPRGCYRSTPLILTHRNLLAINAINTRPDILRTAFSIYGRRTHMLRDGRNSTNSSPYTLTSSFQTTRVNSLNF